MARERIDTQLRKFIALKFYWIFFLLNKVFGWSFWYYRSSQLFLSSLEIFLYYLKIG